jgi:5-methyltetrahydropteroyltriglutamate--homocysteine methyltransferase
MDMKSNDVSASATSTVHGYPRIGRDRELKKVTEAYWKGEVTAEKLHATARTLREQAWRTLQHAGITEIPSNTFSFYDHVLDTIELVDAIPERHRNAVDNPLDRYFAMARGTDDVQPLEMTKWLDTNYHYLVPELDEKTTFALNSEKPFDEFTEAQALDITTRPVLVGPITFLLLSKPSDDALPGFDPLSKLDDLLPVYEQVLTRLGSLGAEWVQFDEPILVKDQPQQVMDAVTKTYEHLATAEQRPKILVSTYFGPLSESLPVLLSTPIDGVGVDITARGGDNFDALMTADLGAKRLFVGIVDGRNIWINDLADSLARLAQLATAAQELVVSSSCSLLHVPIDVELDKNIDDDVTPWLAFADQKLQEIATLTKGLREGASAIAQELATNETALQARRTSERTNVQAVRIRADTVTAAHHRRATAIDDRLQRQHDALALPLLPTTTIGSFPQTSDIRKARRDFAKNSIDATAYETRMEAEIKHVVEMQEALGVDVLVHGEAERNDMVQYFAEQLDGYLTTNNGWVQSYGTRYVRPPIIAGDLSRPKPMTVRWATYAQSLTNKPMKGMLTGPVTMLCWSFVRDDQPWSQTARQMALALRDEVQDLESAGIRIIQVDEPALREGLPLRKVSHSAYLDWATEAFRLTTSGVKDETQIHTHMCYAEFGEIIDAVAALDADVISLEAARSRMAITEELAGKQYPGAVGPGVWDIHSPRVPSTDEMADLLQRAAKVIDARRLWVNPDCGLKTRGEEETKTSLGNLVDAARKTREQLGS